MSQERTSEQSDREGIYFDFGSLLVVYLGAGRYAFEWDGHRMISEPPVAQSFIEWMIRVDSIWPPNDLPIEGSRS